MALSVFYVYIFKSNDYYVTLNDGTIIYNQKLPVTLSTPFNQNTRISVLFHFLFELIALDIYGWIIIGLDSLFTCMLSCITAQFWILGGAFETIKPRCLKRLNLDDNNEIHYPDILNREMMMEINKCIKHLQKLIEICERLEKIYNFQTLGQEHDKFFFKSFNESFGNEFTYLFSTSFELLLYCWFGNDVIDASNAISGSIFSGDWLGATKSFKKSMIITMIRMNTPIYFTIAKFTPLAFNTFLSMARIAYSFYTVLKSGVIGK
nr:putative odorant receptor 92a [Onthophagus taurus]